jgi:hypothetical protein
MRPSTKEKKPNEVDREQMITNSFGGRVIILQRYSDHH